MFADEDLGRNCGMVDFYLGSNNTPKYAVLFDESEELAYDVWGYGSMSYYDSVKDEWIDDPADVRVKEVNKHYFKVQEEINRMMTKESLSAMR